jgi:hypothetical protein
VSKLRAYLIFVKNMNDGWGINRIAIALNVAIKLTATTHCPHISRHIEIGK